MKHLLIILSILLLSSPVFGIIIKVKLFMGGVNVVIMFGKDLEIKKLTQNIKVMLRMEFQMVLVL